MLVFLGQFIYLLHICHLRCCIGFELQRHFRWNYDGADGLGRISQDVWDERNENELTEPVGSIQVDNAQGCDGLPYGIQRVPNVAETNWDWAADLAMTMSLEVGGEVGGRPYFEITTTASGFEGGLQAHNYGLGHCMPPLAVNVWMYMAGAPPRPSFKLGTSTCH